MKNINLDFPLSIQDSTIIDANKKIICQFKNLDQAHIIVKILNSLQDINYETVELYKDFIQKSYYLNIAILNAKINVVDLNTQLLEKAYIDFYNSFKLLIEKTNIKFQADETVKLEKNK